MFLLSSDENLDVISFSSFLQLDHFYGDVNGYRSFKKVNRYFSQFAIYSSWHPDLLFFVCLFFSKFLLRYLVCGEIFQWCIVPWVTFKLLWLNRYCFERIITHYFRFRVWSPLASRILLCSPIPTNWHPELREKTICNAYENLYPKW